MAAQIVSRADAFRMQLQDFPEEIRENVEALAEILPERCNILHGDIYLGHTFSTDLSQLSFNVQKGEWVFTQALNINKTKIVLTEFGKWAGGGFVVGSVVGGVCVYLSDRIPILKRLADKAIVAGGAIGASYGAWKAMSSVHYRVKHLKQEIDIERVRVDKNIQEIMTTLFNICAAEEVSILCRLSGKILHVPIKTKCQDRNEAGELVPVKNPHIFEYSYLIEWLDGFPTCPLCNQDVSLMDLELATDKRTEVSEVIAETLTWLANQQSNESIDIFNKNNPLLGNPQEIVQNIKLKQLGGAELAFLSRLVRREIHDYNKRVHGVFKSISQDITKNLDRLGRREFSRLIAQLNT